MTNIIAIADRCRDKFIDSLDAKSKAHFKNHSPRNDLTYQLFQRVIRLLIRSLRASLQELRQRRYLERIPAEFDWELDSHPLTGSPSNDACRFNLFANSRKDGCRLSFLLVSIIPWDSPFEKVPIQLDRLVYSETSVQLIEEAEQLLRDEQVPLEEWCTARIWTRVMLQAARATLINALATDPTFGATHIGCFSNRHFQYTRLCLTDPSNGRPISIAVRLRPNVFKFFRDLCDMGTSRNLNDKIYSETGSPEKQ